MARATDILTRPSLAALLVEARIIAENAGRCILSCTAGQRHDAEKKTDGSPVTIADRRSHEAICSGLSALRTGLPVVSEESEWDARQVSAAAAWWIVDPLDGTKEFIRGLDEYTVNVALVAGADPVLGVVHVPVAGTTYCAARGGGAWRDDRESGPLPIRPARTANPASAVVSSSHLDERTKGFLRHLSITQAIPRGSSLKICAVAEGQADVYPRLAPTHFWDTAAGTAVAREAGCVVLELAGSDLSYAFQAGLKHEGFIVTPETAREAVEAACAWLADSEEAER